MKTKTLLFLCLLLGIGLTKLSAQASPPPDNKNGTGAVVTKLANIGWWTPVYCDGVQVDLIEGMGDGQYIDHYKDGVDQRQNLVSWSGVGTSDWTGETFTFSEQDNNFYSDKLDTWVIKVNTHVKGSKSSLYNISFLWTLDGNTWVVSVKNATCTGNTR